MTHGRVEPWVHDLDPDLRADIEVAWASAGMARSQMARPAAQSSFTTRLAEKMGPTWAAYLSELRTSLDRSPRALVIRMGSGASSLPVVSAVAVGLGRPVASPATGFSDVFQEIRVRELVSPDSFWHTDSANWRAPNDLTILMCLRTRGGAAPTQLLAADRFEQELPADLRSRLESTPLPWLLDGGLGDEIFDAAVLERGAVRFLRESVERTCALVDRVRSREVTALATEFAERIDACDKFASVSLGVGDILVFDNIHLMHRRGPSCDLDRSREMLRTKVSELSWERDLTAT